MEHRWGERHKTNVPVRLRGQPDAIGQGRLLNLSLSGAWVRTELVPPLFSAIELTLGSPGAPGHPHWLNCRCLSGRVVRQGRHGIGIEWDEAAGETVLDLMQRAAQPPLMWRVARA
ncbi:MAG: hypothetical protein ACRESY_09740 [Steroidobacteraceae bacterium]